MSGERMKSWQKYRMTLLFGVLLGCLGATLIMSKPPVTGLWAQTSGIDANPSWTAGYLTNVQNSGASLQLEQIMASHPEVPLWAGPPLLAGAGSGAEPQAGMSAGAAPRSFFPVWDGSAPEADYARRFAHIPEEQLPGYGRTAYFVDYGEARFWFLNAARLAQEPSVQLDWLQRTAADDPKLHRIVLLGQEPAQPEVWDRLAGSGADLVLIGAKLYAPEAAVTVRPQAGYRSSAHPMWAEWTLSSPGGLLKIQGRDSRLTAGLSGEGDAGRTADRLELDAAGLRQPAGVQERAPVSIGAMWRYRTGGPDLPAAVPPGMDLTGETPARGDAAPPGDWRSPAFNDAGWRWAPAPFGRSKDSQRSQGLRTLLPIRPESPVYYFRKTFVLDEDPAAASEWLLHAAFEDGFAAYLNGVEIARDSIREGLLDYRSLAVPHTGGLYETFPLDSHRSLLVKGVNTLAVEVHTSHPESPEMWFDLSLSYKK